MKNNRRTIQRSLLTSLSVLALSACATQASAPISADANPKMEIERAEAEIQMLDQKQYSLLAPEQFKRAVDFKNSAKKKLAQGADNTKVLSEISISEEAAQNAKLIGDSNSSAVKDVLAARQYALEAKAQDLDEKNFHSVDSDLAAIGHNMEENKFTLDAEQISSLELRYGKSEVASRKTSELREAKNSLVAAKKAGAKNRTPLLLEQANAQVASAEHSIELSPHNPAGYAPTVVAANTAAHKLSEVLALANQNNTSEKVAQALWDKNREIVASKERLIKANADSEANLNKVGSEANAEKVILESQINEKDAILANQKAALGELKSENNQYANEEDLKLRIEQIKKTFTPDEADVMKDGNKLIVRLKRMDFSVGRSDLSPNSFETLKKVDALITAVPASQVTVEGHTDSIGSNSTNKKLSEARAEAVKKYLMSQNLPEQLQVDTVGFGSDKPLTTNKTKIGRATNRRVDIVIQTSVVL